MKLKATVLLLVFALLLVDTECGWRRGWRKVKRAVRKTWHKVKSGATRWIKGKVFRWVVGKGWVMLGDMKQLRQEDEGAYNEMLNEIQEHIAADTNDEIAAEFVEAFDEAVHMSQDKLDELGHLADWHLHLHIGDEDDKKNMKALDDAIESLHKDFDNE